MEGTNNMCQLNIGQTISRAWELTKKHFFIFLALVFLMQLIGVIPNGAQYANYLEFMMKNGGVITDEMMMEAVNSGAQTSIITTIICYILQLYLGIVTYRLANDAAKGLQPDLTARLRNGAQGFLYYLIITIIFSLMIAVGCIFCIIPGVFLAVRFGFAPLIAALHPERSFGDCFEQSWDITKGNFWNLFLLGIVAFALNILGLICCCVGIFVTSIITIFIYIIAYRTLANEDEKPTGDFSSENLTIVRE